MKRGACANKVAFVYCTHFLFVLLNVGWKGENLLLLHSEWLMDCVIKMSTSMDSEEFLPFIGLHHSSINWWILFSFVRSLGAFIHIFFTHTHTYVHAPPALGNCVYGKLHNMTKKRNSLWRYWLCKKPLEWLQFSQSYAFENKNHLHSLCAYIWFVVLCAVDFAFTFSEKTVVSRSWCKMYALMRCKLHNLACLCTC